jgi:hypothetical protein
MIIAWWVEGEDRFRMVILAVWLLLVLFFFFFFFFFSFCFATCCWTIHISFGVLSGWGVYKRVSKGWSDHGRNQIPSVSKWCFTKRRGACSSAAEAMAKLAETSKRLALQGATFGLGMFRYGAKMYSSRRLFKKIVQK